MASVTLTENLIEGHPALAESLVELRQRIEDQFPGVTIVSSKAVSLQTLEVTVTYPDLDVLDSLCHLAVEVGDHHDVTIIILPT
jgi:hypothetical protein